MTKGSLKVPKSSQKNAQKFSKNCAKVPVKMHESYPKSAQKFWNKMPESLKKYPKISQKCPIVPVKLPKSSHKPVQNLP